MALTCRKTYVLPKQVLCLTDCPKLKILTPTSSIVWQSLSSGPDEHESKLQKVWVRFHDNKEVIASTTSLPVADSTAQPPTSSGTPAVLSSYPRAGNSSSDSMSPIDVSYQNTECPSFSVLPPLRSLTVLEIDELAYLVEMSLLIQRSCRSLRELRIGMSKSYSTSSTMPRNTDHSVNQENMDFFIDGGAIGLIMSKLHDCRSQRLKTRWQDSFSASESPASAILTSHDSTVHHSPYLPQPGLSISDNPCLAIPASMNLQKSPENAYDEVMSLPRSSAVNVPQLDSHVTPTPCLAANVPSFRPPVADPHKALQPVEFGKPSDHAHHEKQGLVGSSENVHGQRLNLEILELERMDLTKPVLQRSINWPMLTSLTLIQCQGHEQLWKFLRKTYSPKLGSTFSTLASFGRYPPNRQRNEKSSKSDPPEVPQCRLNLKRIHTDSVSPALISFLKESLAPNSLEWMVLQDRGNIPSSVTVDSIYRGPLRYHRSSLKKVLIDSSEKGPDVRTRNNRWKRWILNREILQFITSGKMSSLKELGMAVDYRDWVSLLMPLLSYHPYH